MYNLGELEGAIKRGTLHISGLGNHVDTVRRRKRGAITTIKIRG